MVFFVFSTEHKQKNFIKILFFDKGKRFKIKYVTIKQFLVVLLLH